jgi:aarF domain-containing kinase
VTSKKEKTKTELAQTAFARSMKLASLAGKLWTSEVSRVVKGIANPQEGALLLKTRMEQASMLVEQLGQLKGAAMKLGQMLALESRDLFPDEVVAILEKLQNNASFMERHQVEKILQTELGEKVSDFSHFSSVPIAAASVGQVHTAELFGKKVAIKIQYPGVQDSIDSDLKILNKLMGLIANLTGKSQMDFSALVAEMGSIFRQETDYILEAELLEKYRAQAKLIEGIKTPEVYRSHSSSKVLTLSYEAGVSITEALRADQLSLTDRDYYAHQFLNLYTKEFCEWGLVQTDPNLGNFLIDVKNRNLVLLDFGATKVYDFEFRKMYSKLIMAAFDKNKELSKEIVLEMGLLDPREEETGATSLLNLLFESMQPFREDVYDFNNDDYADKMRELSRSLIRDLKFTPPPRQIIFLHRKLGGIFQILRRLQVKRDLKPYLEAFKVLAEQK